MEINPPSLFVPIGLGRLSTIGNKLAGLALTMFLVSPLAGQVDSNIQLNAQSNYGTPSQQSVNTSSLGTYVASATPLNPVGATAVGVVEDGLIGASVSGEADVAYNSVGSSSATASVSYQDHLTFYDPNLAIGTQITLHINFGLFGNAFLDSTPAPNGNLMSYANFNSSVQLGLELNGSTEGFTAMGSDSDGVPGTTTFLNTGIINEQTTISNGQNYTLNMQMDLSGNAGAGGFTGDASVGNMLGYFNDDFQNTLAWGGVVSAFDQSGDQISIPDISSSSGIDYNQSFIPAADLTNSVPDGGATATMICMAVAGLASFRRRVAR
jgi:hypothetical protein